MPVNWDTVTEDGGSTDQPPVEQKKKNLWQRFGHAAVAAGHFVGDINRGAMKGVASTLESASGIGQKLDNAAIGGLASIVGGGSHKKELQMPIAKLPSKMTTPSNTGQRVGKAAEQFSELLIPVGGAEKAVAMLPGKVAKAAPVVSKVFRAVGDAAEWAGKTLVQTGDTKKATAAGLTAGVTNIAGSAISGAWGSIKGDLQKNIGRAFGAGKGAVSDLVKNPQKAANALKVISNLKDDIMVGEGEARHVFDPAKATWGEMAQAIVHAKQHVYNAYSDLAAQAGEAGASFTTKEFNQVIDSIKGLTKDTNPSIANKVKEWIGSEENGWSGYIQKNFGTYNPSDGKHYIKNVDFERVQKFLEGVNKGINWNSDAAGSVVGKELASGIRKVMDHKISQATGEGYQSLRNTYSDLKSIEDAVMKQTRKAAVAGGKTTSGIANWMERFGSIDAVAGILTHGVSEAIRGIGLVGAAEMSKYLKSSETALRTAFSLVERGTKDLTPSTGRQILKAGMIKGATSLTPPGGPQ